ncbi:DUF6894 family protein (plasmid) [Microvirga sp. RSM25]|uniref:DUF6894 family protein n=1 Tax=Microvirga sp. RSM25 TaxID=3273802 RepID=UPI00384D013C
MPRYFFHIHTEHRMIWDRTGLDLPDIRGAPASQMAMTLWSVGPRSRASDRPNPDDHRREGPSRVRNCRLTFKNGATDAFHRGILRNSCGRTGVP